MGLLAAPIGRRAFLAGLASALLPAACAWRRPDTTRPNLILIMTDDQSWDSIGYASAGLVRTPNLDRLASEGMIFERGHCSSMPCVASRASMMSGLHQHRWRHTATPGAGLKQGAWTWAHALRAAGYQTALFGKMHFLPRDAQHGFDIMELCDPWPGRAPERLRDDWEAWLVREGVFDAWVKTAPQGVEVGTWPLPIRYHRISWVTDRAIEFLSSRPTGAAPHAIAVSYLAPHPPYDPAEPFASLYDPDQVVLPQEHWLDMQDMPSRLRNIPRPFDRVPEGERTRRTTIAATRALVSQLDDAIGRLAEHIDRSTTLVVFASDHGDYLGKRGQMWKSPTIPFDALARIPFFACGAGVPGGQRYPYPVSLVDLAPTFLAAAGAEIPPDLDGRALQECFRAPTSGADRAVYCFGGDGFDLLERAGVKYFQSHDGAEEMLFDLASDPGELVNLAGQPAWRQALAALRSEMALVKSKPAPRLERFPPRPDARPRAQPSDE